MIRSLRSAVLALALVVRAQHEKDTFNLGDGPAIRAALVRWFRVQKQHTLAYLHHLPGHRADGPTELPSKLPNFDGDTPKMVEDMTPLITATWDKAGRKFREQIGLDPDQWKVINPHVKGKIQNATMAFCAETNQTTSKLLNQALADLRAELVTGIVDEGEGLVELTKRVERVFENAETWRARRIAATENSRARHEAELESAVESEVVAGFQWLLSEGACALCYHISDQVKQMPLGENFAVIGHNEHYKNIRTPPLHPGCRCSQLAILKPEYGGPAEPKWGKTAVQPKVEEKDSETFPYADQHSKVRPTRPNDSTDSSTSAPVDPLPEPTFDNAQPAGAPVSNALLLQESKLKPQLQRVLDAINAVHGDGVLPEIPTKLNNNKVLVGTLKLDKETRHPLRIEISRKGPTPGFAYLHEIGHFLDRSGIPGWDKRWSHYSEDEHTGPVMKAIVDSKAVKNLFATYENPPEDDPGSKNYAKYLLLENELWARAYSQYIVTRSRDAVLLADLRLQQNARYAPYKDEQWADDDFKPIAKAIDNLFANLGWRK